MSSQFNSHRAAEKQPMTHAQIAQKWQRFWEDHKTFSIDLKKAKDPFYVLVMFPYPSGDKLHIGHWYQYSLVDTWARFNLMLGKEVFQPMGFDAFGLPAENFAIKQGIHPDVSTSKNVAYMIEQFKKMGVTYDWQYYINTSKPEYYRWTQWLFLQFYKKGLAYRKEAPVNWCTSCQTVLANEQVQDGTCERCGSEIVRKNLRQWFLKITDYAQPLLDGIDSLDWPQRTKAMQKNWIGRSEGAEISFAVKNHSEKIEVFTTRPDTLFGVTYLTLAPEHPFVDKLTHPERRQAVEQYREQTSKMSELDRLSTEKEKTGVFIGAYALHPLTQEEIPIWIGDYVLYTYGTGAVMAVPAHDERDFYFAEKYGLTLKEVIVAPNAMKSQSRLEKAYTEAGMLIESGIFSGMASEIAKAAIIKELETKKCGLAKITYRLRDWLVSRQRYWGTPIPIIYCNDCGEVPVPEQDLPVKLPENVDFKPSGESPLARCQEFVQTTCPKCKKAARREVDTLDTFVCSSWYYLRFPCAQLHTAAFDKDLLRRVLPVDKYVGGPEHACMHLLFVRFFNRVLYDLGYVDFQEPFQSLVHQGLVLGTDGQKMSKSKGNTMSPDHYVEKFGADALRMYLAFGFNYVDGGPWDDGGFIAVTRFLDKIQRLIRDHRAIFGKEVVADSNPNNRAEKELLTIVHQSIKGARLDTERFMFNTSVARMMELYNGVTDYLRKTKQEEWNRSLLKVVLTDFIKLLAPYAPHLSEELWEQIGHQPSIFKQAYPIWDERFLVPDLIEMAVMINGKLRAQIEVPKNADEEQVVKIARNSEKLQKHLEAFNIIKHIFVPGKLVNFIAKPRN